MHETKEPPGGAKLTEGTVYVVFQDGAIKMAPLAGGEARELCEGYDGEIAPGGKQLAYTHFGKNGSRAIAVYDITTKTSRILRRPPGENNYGPRWSQDGKRLIFNHYTGNAWLPAIVDVNDTECRIIGKSALSDFTSGLYSPCWGAGGMSVFCQNLDSLFCFTDAGKLLWKRSMTDIMGRYADSVSGSSATKLALHPDGKTLLMGLSAVDGTLGLVYTLDTKSFEINRTGSIKYHMMDPAWTPDGLGMVFSGCPLSKSVLDRIQNMEDVPIGIYYCDIGGRNIRKIASNGSYPACASIAPM